MQIKPEVQTLLSKCIDILQSAPLGSVIISEFEKANILIQSAGDSPTHYTNRFNDEATGVQRPAVLLSNQMGSMSKDSGAIREACSMIAHEMIHALHATENGPDFKFRNTSEPDRREFDNQEEELTITGRSGRFEDPRNENAIRQELGLPPRSKH
ncbi:M91 family zinc metallopeptidase [Limnobacter sp.]|uniref:M91 family zinc metallopeptidase n=1 Tax=Limnobacter sp. TaxID=2003368 RepID=UPI00258E5B2E|nr:M91 family zinc metallopeptidase [Limnobacter sp.]